MFVEKKGDCSILHHDLLPLWGPSADAFVVQMRRHGWEVVAGKPFVGDSQVLQGVHAHERETAIWSSYHAPTLYEAFGENSFRKVLRAFLGSNGANGYARADLRSFCQTDQELAKHLSFLKEEGLIIQEGSQWKRGPAQAHIHDLGHSVEWYVATWFQTSLQVPSRYGVHLKHFPVEGDLDVIAFVEEKPLLLECKSSTHVSDQDVVRFLQRVDAFAPALAVFLIDCEEALETPVAQFNKRLPAGKLLSPYAPGVYWNTGMLYVTNVRESFGATLLEVLRHFRARLHTPLFGGLGSLQVWQPL